MTRNLHPDRRGQCEPRLAYTFEHAIRDLQPAINLSRTRQIRVWYNELLATMVPTEVRID